MGRRMEEEILTRLAGFVYGYTCAKKEKIRVVIALGWLSEDALCTLKNCRRYHANKI